MKKTITLLCAFLSISAVNAFALSADDITWSADSISTDASVAKYQLENGKDLKMYNDTITIYNGAESSATSYWSLETSSKSFTVGEETISFTNRLKSGGAGVFGDDGKPASRVMGITVRDKCQLQIFALSSSSSETHTLQVGVYDETEQAITVVAEASVAKSTSDAVRGNGYVQLTYSPSEETTTPTELLQYSKSGGINFYGINVVYGEELDASNDSGLATDTYEGSKTFEDSETSAELTATEILGTVDATEATYVIFTSDSPFTVTVGNENKALKSTYEVVLLASDFDFTSESASITISGTENAVISWTVYTTEYVAEDTEGEGEEYEEPVELTGVTYEYIFNNDIMTGLAGEGGILNGESAVASTVIYFTPESASTTATEGDGILSWATSVGSNTGSKILTDNASTDGVYTSALTSGAKTQSSGEDGFGAYFTVTCPEDYDGYYMQVRATFYANGDGSRSVGISTELAQYDKVQDGNLLGSASSTGKSDMVVAVGTKQMEAGESLYVITNNNVGYYAVVVVFSETYTEDPDAGDGGEGPDSISSIANDNVVEVARYNILGQKIEGAQKGINIVKYSDGSTQKVLVK